MSLFSINKEPTTKQLVQFGFISAIALPLIGWWWNADWGVILLLAGIGIAMAVLAYVLPQVVRPLFIGLSLVTFPIGLLISTLLVFLIYALLFVPIGLLFRIIGRDVLERRINRNQSTYWSDKKITSELSNYFRQS